MQKTFQYFSLLFSSFALITCFSIRASADTVYSDFGATPTYEDANGQAVQGQQVFFNYSQQVAVPFTPTANYNLTQILISLTGELSPTFPDAANVAIVSDSGGNPGTTIASWNLSGLPSSQTGTANDSIAVTGVSVSAGTQYWIVATPSDANTYDLWNSNSAFTAGNEEINRGSGWISLEGGGFGYQLGGLEVLGTLVPTPEPASAALMIGGFALVAARWARKRRKA